jgi:copper chaperone CopZ
MPTTTLTITGMQSDDCLRTVMNAIQDLPCIGYVDVSLETGHAEIAGTPAWSPKATSARPLKKPGFRHAEPRDGRISTPQLS